LLCFAPAGSWSLVVGWWFFCAFWFVALGAVFLMFAPGRLFGRAFSALGGAQMFSFIPVVVDVVFIGIWLEIAPDCLSYVDIYKIRHDGIDSLCYVPAFRRPLFTACIEHSLPGLFGSEIRESMVFLGKA
jgi:hypothetical protein